VAQICSNLAQPMQSSMVSQTFPLENRPNDLDDFSVPQEDVNVVIDSESLRVGNHKPWDPQAWAILALPHLTGHKNHRGISTTH
jgi:hypothetical protein